MFAEFWDAFSKDPVPKQMLLKSGYQTAPDESNGYILPYYDSPMRDEPASNTLFTEMLSMATLEECHQISEDDVKRDKMGMLLDGVLRIAAPLL